MAIYVPRSRIEAELLASLESGEKLTVLVGPRGAGKTTLLLRLQSLLERSRPAALVQLEPIAASPEILYERFLALAANAVTPAPENLHPFSRFLASLARGRPDAVLLLDEFTEIRTLSYFPGVERPLESFLAAATEGRAPAIIATSRFPTWLASRLPGLPAPVRERISIKPLPPLAVEELGAFGVAEAEWLVAATGGLPLHVGPILERRDRGLGLAEAIAAELGVGGRLETECRATFAQLLQQARGYGACKSALHVLAAEEGLTLSEIARRMQRTAGSVRDYLWWLQEVELVTARGKRFFFVDPILKLWLRVYGAGRPPSGARIREDVERHLARSAAAAPRPEPAAQPVFMTDDQLIEID